MDQDGVSLYLHVAAGGSCEFDEALHRSIGGGFAQDYLDGGIGQAHFRYAEGFAVVRLGFGFVIFLFTFYGEAEAELFGRAGQYFAQGEVYLVGLTGFEGAFDGDETHGLASVPLDVTFHGRFETEQAVGRHLGGFFYQVHSYLRVGIDDTAGIGLDVGSKILCGRFTCRLPGAAGRQQTCRGQHQHLSVFRNHLTIRLLRESSWSFSTR